MILGPTGGACGKCYKAVWWMMVNFIHAAVHHAAAATSSPSLPAVVSLRSDYFPSSSNHSSTTFFVTLVCSWIVLGLHSHSIQLIQEEHFFFFSFRMNEKQNLGESERWVVAADCVFIHKQTKNVTGKSPAVANSTYSTKFMLKTLALSLIFLLFSWGELKQLWDMCKVETFSTIKTRLKPTEHFIDQR